MIGDADFLSLSFAIAAIFAAAGLPMFGRSYTGSLQWGITSKTRFKQINKLPPRREWNLPPSTFPYTVAVYTSRLHPAV